MTEVRSGVGALAAVEFDPELRSAAEVAALLRAEGVLTRAIGSNSLQVSPPLCITTDQVQAAADACAVGPVVDRLGRACRFVGWRGPTGPSGTSCGRDTWTSTSIDSRRM